ncbi:helix-turn-helix transcriptional regulator [Xanthomonas campestris pv. campestris]|uniref:helix-turn-helix domain-containing protein n=1 Tax=Xanthomonas campestris TaxID=339 RepID=UPI002B3961DD|nr:helix-turn-helix transcriptional regulator [Xanthomonas campestris pv. campestris]MEB2229580.1 helix-turn-helix transcriptional regulator [Xanthomonas campestris pv. campestris]
MATFAILANATQTWNSQTAGSVSNRSIFATVPAPIPPARTLGRRLREARQARGMTQAELGAVLGLEDENSAAPRISRYERGDRMPDEKTMESLAEALELPVAYFHATSDVIADAILLIAGLPVDKQQEVLSKLREWVASGNE